LNLARRSIYASTTIKDVTKDGARGALTDFVVTPHFDERKDCLAVLLHMMQRQRTLRT
jgi:hypothetical protein